MTDLNNHVFGGPAPQAPSFSSDSVKKQKPKVSSPIQERIAVLESKGFTAPSASPSIPRPVQNVTSSSSTPMSESTEEQPNRFEELKEKICSFAMIFFDALKSVGIWLSDKFRDFMSSMCSNPSEDDTGGLPPRSSHLTDSHAHHTPQEFPSQHPHHGYMPERQDLQDSLGRRFPEGVLNEKVVDHGQDVYEIQVEGDPDKVFSFSDLEIEITDDEFSLDDEKDPIEALSKREETQPIGAEEKSSSVKDERRKNFYFGRRLPKTPVKESKVVAQATNSQSSTDPVVEEKKVAENPAPNQSQEQKPGSVNDRRANIAALLAAAQAKRDQPIDEKLKKDEEPKKHIKLDHSAQRDKGALGLSQSKRRPIRKKNMTQSADL